MERVARLPAAERAALFAETAARMRTTPAVAEKDFWVTWVLARLFADAGLARLLMFKGGTSLSKVYRLIERFSEGIDLILDWRVLSAVSGNEDPLAARSKARQEKLNAAINEQAQAYIAGPLLARVAAALGEVCRCAVAGDDPTSSTSAIRRPSPTAICAPSCGWKSGRWRPGCRTRTG